MSGSNIRSEGGVYVHVLVAGGSGLRLASAASAASLVPLALIMAHSLLRRFIATNTN